MIYEIHSASKDNTLDEVRAGVLTTFPDWKIESVKDSGDEWLVRIVQADEKPPFLDDGAPDADPADDEDGADDKDAPEDSKDDKPADDKGDKKDKGKGDDKGGDIVAELTDLLTQLQDVVKQVTDTAGEGVKQVQDHQDKLDKAKDALGDEAGLDGDTPAPPLPGDAKGLDDVPNPGAGPGGPGGPPMPPRRPGVPTGKPGRPGMPGSGGGPGLPTFTNVEVATHPGVNESGERISLLAAAQDLESDADFADYEVIGMIENPDGSYSAKLKKKN